MATILMKVQGKKSTKERKKGGLRYLWKKGVMSNRP